MIENCWDEVAQGGQVGDCSSPVTQLGFSGAQEMEMLWQLGLMCCLWPSCWLQETADGIQSV